MVRRNGLEFIDKSCFERGLTLLKIRLTYRSISLFIAVMSSHNFGEITVKTTVANATRIQRLSAVACCVRVVMSRLGNCRV